MAFVTTILACGGVSANVGGYKKGFYDYRTAWGDSHYDETKGRLASEGVKIEDDYGLSVNYPAWPSLSSDEKETLSNDLAEYFFDIGWDYYRHVLAPIFASPESRYIVAELSKVGHHPNEDSVKHIMNAVGPQYYQEAIAPLAK